MKKLILGCLLFAGIRVFSQDPALNKNLTNFVNPFIGTQEMGHTFPGAVVPHGFVQLSPDTDTIPYDRDGKYNPPVYRYCAGYQYNDPTIVGFSHTHFSGTGHSDLGDFLVMPETGCLRLIPGTADHPETGYRSRFRHETEKAEPGYYRVQLDDPGVLAELTATPRCGMHRYTFPVSDSARIILDLFHGIYNYDGKVVWAYVRVVNDTLVEGYRITSGWARTRYIYFALAFSKPFESYGYKNDEKVVYRGFWRKFKQEEDFPEMFGRKLRAHFDFETVKGETVLLKMGLSAVSMDGARKNLQSEIPGWDFDQVRTNARESWEKELEKVQITGTQQQKINFYTAMYHALIHPSLYEDVDGRYRGNDQEIHSKTSFTNYTVFSLWDTYRALHPLMTLLDPAITADFVNSMLAHYDQSAEHMLPVWSHHGNENWCMIGYHSVAVIADAAVKGVPGFGLKRALEACVKTSSNRWYQGEGDYIDRGYIPEDHTGNSASITLEYAYDDYAISRLAAFDGSRDLAVRYEKRSGNFENVFDPSTGFMRAKLSDGTWKSPFDPLSTNGQGFIEGNSWNYSFYVPQDVPGLIRLMGGEKRFINRLDSLFTMYLDEKHFQETEDVTRSGIIGNYVHGNEPSHHIPYLYDWTSRPWKTQERIRQIMDTMYHNTPDGMCGNDDCGQMSAWYIFSALGFYPVCPGTAQYALGVPLTGKAVVELPGGKTLTIIAENLSAKNGFVQSVSFNGIRLSRPFIDHSDLVNGGTLLFLMGPKPNRSCYH